MTIKSNLSTLILCSFVLLLTPLAQADDFRSNFRSDKQKSDWRTTRDNRAADNRYKRDNDDCGPGQDCTRPNRKDNAKTRSTDTPRLQWVRPLEGRPNTRVEKVDRERPTVRVERADRDRPAVRVERTDRDRPAVRVEKDRRDKPATRPILPLGRDITTHRPRPIATVKRPRHHIIYSDRIRRDYRYIRGPWYNTRYIAPLPIRFDRIGYRRNVLPRSYVRIMIGGFPYFYYTGVFYRPYGSSYIVVAAPIGAFVRSLPVGFIAFSVGLSTYYYVNDTYYEWDDYREGYVVVEEPPGAPEAIEKATAARLMVYPNKGQSEELQAKDRYECHRWAVNESGFDPTLEEEEYNESDNDLYRRAIAACLEGRGYTVK